MEEEIDIKNLKKQRVLFGSAIIALFYLFISSNYGTLNFSQWNKIEKERLQEERARVKYEVKIDSIYDNILNNIPTFKDSLNFYLQNKLPIYFEEPSLKQKERIITQNNLEKYLK
jgi:hypothetical protein